MNETLTTIEKPLDELRPHPDNPRKIGAHGLAQLKKMLAQDPGMLQARPLIALPDGTVIGGNQRLVAARELGWDTIPVVTVELSEAQALLWMIRDNTSAGEWDDAALGDVLGKLPGQLDLTGLDAGALDRALASLAKADTRDPNAMPPARPEPRSKPGEVYELGPHLLMCGDATDEQQVRELFAPPRHHAIDSVDCVWTDPPYGVSYVGRTEDALTIRNDGATGLADLIEAALRNATKACDPNARFYIAGPSGPRAADFHTAIAAAGWRLHQVLVWVKNRIIVGHSDYHYQHELLFYGWVPRDESAGRPGRGKHHGTRWYGGNDQSSVLFVDAPQRSAEHPTMKPVELIERCLTNSTTRGAFVYDPFGGSGTTLIACERMGRRARLMELDPVYCDVIRDRYDEFVAAGEAAA